jgi:hypothetical protein
MEQDKNSLVVVVGLVFAYLLLNKLGKAATPSSQNSLLYSRPQQRYRVAGSTAKVQTSPGSFSTTVMVLKKENEKTNTIIGNGKFSAGWLDDHVQVFARSMVNGKMKNVVGWLDTDYITPIL